MSNLECILVDLPSGAPQFELTLLPPREGEHGGYPAVRFDEFEDLSVMDIPHVVAKLMELHCAAVSAVLSAAKEQKKT